MRRGLFVGVQNNPYYLTYEGPLPTTSPKEVKVDITITER
jgi:hypothetical protein